MSDEPQGDGWWQASDLKWYPPERLPKERLPLPSEFEGAPAKPPRQRRPVLIAALVAVVAIAAAGITSYLLVRPHSRAPQTSTAQPAAPSTPAAQTAASSTPAAQPAAPSSGTVPPATAPSPEVPGLTPFVGTWRAHASGLDIQPTGTGRLTYADLTACPTCPYATAPTATVDFTLTSVSGDTATGMATAVSQPKNDTVGEPVTAKVVNGGQGLEVSMGRMQQFPFCNSNVTSDYYHYYCGG